MKPIWIVSDNIISPLGMTSEANYDMLRQGQSGINAIRYPQINEELYLGKIGTLADDIRYKALTRFERLAVQSAEAALQHTALDTQSARVLFIISTTKGNIELLEQGRDPDPRIHLHEAAKNISSFFGNSVTPVVVSSACISGVMALLTGKYLLESGQYDHAVVIGADILSYFVISGFRSLKALSDARCQPFDKSRSGINLGEAAATIVLSSDPSSLGKTGKIRIAGGGLSNDANHISGPSRTGEELNMAIHTAFKEAGTDKASIDFVSAHGTATLYNDEMESKAFHLAGVSNKPVHSLKAYFGHTLGAAGVLESIICAHSLLNNELIQSLGFEELGVSQPLNIIQKTEQKNINTCLKTASGFGGCNAALILKKAI